MSRVPLHGLPGASSSTGERRKVTRILSPAHRHYEIAATIGPCHRAMHSCRPVLDTGAGINLVRPTQRDCGRCRQIFAVRLERSHPPWPDWDTTWTNRARMLSASRAREGGPGSANRADKTGQLLPISFPESAPDAISESTRNI